MVLKQPQGSSLRSKEVGQGRQTRGKVQDAQGAVLNMGRFSCADFKSAFFLIHSIKVKYQVIQWLYNLYLIKNNKQW